MRRPTSVPLRPVAALLLVPAGAGLPVFLLGGFAVPIRAELDMSNAQLGSVVSGFMVAATLAAMPAARLVERVRSSVALRSAAALATASLVGAALFASSWTSLLLLIGVTGLAMALAEPAGTVLVAALVPPRRYGAVLGLRQAAFPAAAAASGLLVAALGTALGWRWTYAVAALATVAGFLITPAPPARTVDRPAPSRGRLEASRAAMWTLAVAAGLGSAGGASFNAFVVTSAMDAGMGRPSAGLLFAAASGIGFPLRLLFGHLADREGRDSLRVAALVAAVGVAGHLMLATGHRTATIAGAFLAFGLGWSWIGVVHLAVVRLNPLRPGGATAFVQSGNYLGAMVGPILFGALADRWSYDVGWTVIAGLLALSALGLFLVRRLAAPVPAVVVA